MNDLVLERDGEEVSVQFQERNGELIAGLTWEVGSSYVLTVPKGLQSDSLSVRLSEAASRTLTGEEDHGGPRELWRWSEKSHQWVPAVTVSGTDQSSAGTRCYEEVQMGWKRDRFQYRFAPSAGDWCFQLRGPSPAA